LTSPLQIRPASRVGSLLGEGVLSVFQQLCSAKSWALEGEPESKGTQKDLPVSPASLLIGKGLPLLPHSFCSASTFGEPGLGLGSTELVQQGRQASAEHGIPCFQLTEQTPGRRGERPAQLRLAE